MSQIEPLDHLLGRVAGFHEAVDQGVGVELFGVHQPQRLGDAALVLGGVGAVLDAKAATKAARGPPRFLPLPGAGGFPFALLLAGAPAAALSESNSCSGDSTLTAMRLYSAASASSLPWTGLLVR